MSHLELQGKALFSIFLLLSSWSAIFFYVYTSRIAFAPLTSRGIKRTTEENGTSDSSAPVPNPSQQSGVADSSSPERVAIEACSPKSVYALASKVGRSFRRFKLNSR